MCHALERYRIHHPEAEFEDLMEAYQASEEISSEIALSMVGRRIIKTTSKYFLVPDRRGLVVTEQGTFVTYLRFHSSQEDFALKHWPPYSPNCYGRPTTIPRKQQEACPPTQVCLTSPLEEGETEEESNRKGNLTPHPEVGVSFKEFRVQKEFILKAGSRKGARKVFLRAVKVDCSFDRDTWVAIYLLEDPETGIRLQAVCPHQGQAFLTLVL